VRLLLAFCIMTRIRRMFPVFGAVLFALVAGACTSTPSQPAGVPPQADGGAASAQPGSVSALGASRPISAGLALLTFDSAWSRIAHTHFDSIFARTTWAEVRTELRPQAAAATSLQELRAVLTAMLARVGESHFVLIPAEAADALGTPEQVSDHVAGDAGLAIRLVGNAALVWRVEPDGPAAQAGIHTGWEVVAIDGRLLAPRLERVAALPPAEARAAGMRLGYQLNGELDGEPGTDIVLTLRNDSAQPREHVLTRRRSPGEMVRFGNLPPMRAVLEYSVVDGPFTRERTTANTTLDGEGDCVGVIRMNVWMVPLMPQLDRAINALRGCRGIVLDLRGNPGGVAGMVMGTAGHFVQDAVSLGVMRTRTSELRFRANPRRVSPQGEAVEPFAGPLAIVVDELSASTSEIFAAGMQGIGRARVFGAQTAGQALPAVMLRLPTNDVLMHAIADFDGPGGVRIEGDGVIPDEAVSLSRADLLAGRDSALERAVAWIRSTTRPVTGGHDR
jgi:carboxyl-terminal processing protease